MWELISFIVLIAFIWWEDRKKYSGGIGKIMIVVYTED